MKNPVTDNLCTFDNCAARSLEETATVIRMLRYAILMNVVGLPHLRFRRLFISSTKEACLIKFIQTI